MLLKPTCRQKSFFRLAIVFWIGVMGAERHAPAQDTPLISGGAGFFTSTNGGNTTYIPTLAPVLAAPLGQYVLVESRATLLEAFFPSGGGYDTTHFIGLAYLQGDYIATPHLTVVGGYFLTPFGTYNERLSPIWINNFQDAPLIASIGTMTGSGTGGMVRGSAVSTPKFSVDYAYYFSATSTNEQFHSSRSTGGRVGVFFPKPRLEVGASYGRLLEGTHQNYSGVYVWWLPPQSAFQLRSEYAHAPHSQGYWIETDYRLSRFGGRESWVGRLEPVFRWQQTFRNSPDPSDGLPAADTQQVEIGLDYHLPHELRINTNYARQFSATGDRNLWKTGIVYRFLFPTWKGRK